MSLAEQLIHDSEPWVPEDTFGARLALVRQRKSWNIAEAARACKVDPQSWANWEDGASPRKFEQVTTKIAAASGCNRLWLLAGDAAVPRSRCFSPLSLVSDVAGQLEFAFSTPAELSLV